MRNRKAAILDFDDTLLATYEQRSILIIEVARIFNYQITNEIIKQNWGKPFYQLITDMMPGINFEKFQKTYSQAMQASKPKMQEGAKSFLQFLNKQGALILIVSSSSRDLLIQDLSVVGLKKYVDFIWGYEDTFYYKPDPRSLEQALLYINKVGIDTQYTVSIGDSPNDYLAARNNNISFFAVTTGHNSREDFEKTGLDTNNIFANLPQFLKKGSSFLAFFET